MFRNEEGFEGAESNYVKAETEGNASPQERRSSSPRLQMKESDAGADSRGNQEKRHGKHEEQGDRKGLVEVLALDIGGCIDDAEEEASPDKERGSTAKDGESGSAGDARGTTSGIPNGLSHGWEQAEHIGGGERRVRRREVCAKRHLTFAFFSPRV